MVKIAIVDDDKQVLKIVSKKIEEVFGVEVVQLYQFVKAAELLESLKKEEYAIVITDIEMPVLNGMELGKRVKKQYPNTYLIFLTAFPNYAAESYTIDANQYVLKSEMEERLPLVLERFIKQISESKQKYRMIGGSSTPGKIYLKDIIYIRKIKGTKYITYYTVYGEFKERIGIEQMLIEMDSEDFLMIERGYAVNLRHIIRLKGNTMYLSNGEECIISRTRVAQVKEKIHSYWGNF